MVLGVNYGPLLMFEVQSTVLYTYAIYGNNKNMQGHHSLCMHESDVQIETPMQTSATHTMPHFS